MTLLLPLLLTASLHAAPPPATPPAGDDTAPRSIRTIEIDASKVSRVYRVRTSIGIPAIIELPEAFEVPVTCGDCVEELPANAPPEAVEDFHKSPALFLLTTNPEQRYLTLRPKQYPVSMRGTVPDEDYLTTLTLRLKSHLTLTLQVEYAPRDKADARVVFTLPNRTQETAYVRDTLAKERATLEAQYATRVEEGALQALLNAFVEPHQCAAKSSRTRADNLVLEVTELCRFGSRLFVRFTVENRSRQTAELGDVAVKASLNGAAAMELQLLGRRFTTETLPFGATSVGIAAADVLDATAPVSGIELTVVEQGGKGRQLTLSRLDF